MTVKGTHLYFSICTELNAGLEGIFEVGPQMVEVKNGRFHDATGKLRVLPRITDKDRGATVRLAEFADPAGSDSSIAQPFAFS